MISIDEIPYQSYFYPRSPCGERQQSSSYSSYLEEFLSTLSLRRATEIQLEFNSLESISIHALLAESDFAAGR